MTNRPYFFFAEKVISSQYCDEFMGESLNSFSGRQYKLQTINSSQNITKKTKSYKIKINLPRFQLIIWFGGYKMQNEM